MMSGLAGALFLLVFGGLAYGWLYVRQHGRAYVWGWLAARCRANHEAALLRERRTAELKAEWGVVR